MRACSRRRSIRQAAPQSVKQALLALDPGAIELAFALSLLAPASNTR
ncbi:hypothetical protein [Bradyrhizobium ottawaense]